MTKLKFLLTLNEKLANYPQAEVEEQLSFYSEMIEDRMEEGLTEEEAVSAIGPVDEIAAQIAAELSPEKKEQRSKKPKQRLKIWEIVLLVLGSPVWLSLLVAAFALVISLYVSLWSVVISLWAVFASFVISMPAAIALGVGVSVGGFIYSGIATVAAGLVLGGLSVFLFFGCKAATKGTAVLTKIMVVWLKKCFVKKEEEK
ncbi:MAG: DUF1700 domain-containing protein [Oscillospiraceae bacterium]|nr:DUF1700 domain-containing protein [Oscillospiraceae bacterium]